ncbi:MAG TPA: hypothetical protein VL295_09640, partial [Gemmatimonadales bacterium]|nr:hypothetical protein [Gemmatimonadales bacterium]
MELTLPDLALDPARFARLTAGAVVVSAELGLLRVTGSGAVQCLQGLVTNDLVKPGPNTVTWGALLTPKGMIESDLWCLRSGEDLILVLPLAGMAKTLATFKRSLPPRLARTEELSDSWSALLLIGGNAEASLRDSGVAATVPAPGHLAATDQGVIIARAPAGSPFDFLVV